MGSSGGTLEQYVSLLNDPEWLARMYIYFVNHRVYEVSDPLTYTLVQMATSPVQMTFCESGLLPFRTNELPVFPFAEMPEHIRDTLHTLLSGAGAEHVHESAYADGKVCVSVTLKPAQTIDRKGLLLAFVTAVQTGSNIDDQGGEVQRRFCKIIIQRFLSSVTTPSNVVADVMAVIDN